MFENKEEIQKIVNNFSRNNNIDKNFFEVSDISNATGGKSKRLYNLSKVINSNCIYVIKYYKELKKIIIWNYAISKNMSYSLKTIEENLSKGINYDYKGKGFHPFEQSKVYFEEEKNLLNLLNEICSVESREENIFMQESKEYNVKRVKDKKEWKKIIENEEKITNSKILEILSFMLECKNFTSYGKRIAEYFKVSVGEINLEIARFGKRIINLTGISNQTGETGENRYWNIPFETVFEENSNKKFTWKIRKELLEALKEKYNLIDYKDNSIDNKINEYVKNNSYSEYMNKISQEIKIRNNFTKKFSMPFIKNMELEDYVIGRADIDDSGKNSFCYLIETQMKQLGEMRGSTSHKFGIYYSEEGKYVYTKKYGNNETEVLETIKKEILELLINGKNDNYEEIEKSKIAPIFRGKILSTYYPEKYLDIFKEDDVDKFLNILEINYDINEYDTVEKKKKLLKKFKESKEKLKDKSDYYFCSFLYDTYRNELDIEHTINGEIDYNLQFVDFNYIRNHISKKQTFRSKETDYDKINRNKKDIGNRGENAVLEYEKRKLKLLGYDDLIGFVEKTNNDALGYDIDSFDENKKPLHIEVKTSNANSNNIMEFYISDNEVQRMSDDNSFCIYYVYGISNKRPKCHIVNKEILLKNKEIYFKPIVYKISIDVDKKEL